MKFLLRLPRELHSYLVQVSNTKEVSMNEYIINLIKEDLSKEQFYSEKLEQKRLLTDINNILNKQNHAINELNKWNEIHANMLYEILGVENYKNE